MLGIQPTSRKVASSPEKMTQLLECETIHPTHYGLSSGLRYCAIHLALSWRTIIHYVDRPDPTHTLCVYSILDLVGRVLRADSPSHWPSLTYDADARSVIVGLERRCGEKVYAINPYLSVRKRCITVRKFSGFN